MRSPSTAATAAAVIACANIILFNHQIPVVHGFTTISTAASFQHYNAFAHTSPVKESATSLWVSSTTSTDTAAPKKAQQKPKQKKSPSNNAPKKSPQKPQQKKPAGKTTASKQATKKSNADDDNKKPGSRLERKKQFMMKKWKGEQKTAKKRIARQQYREGNDSRLVSAVGMSVSDIQKQVNPKPNQKKNTASKEPANDDSKKIWNAKADRMTQQKNKSKNSSENQGKKPASTKGLENVLPWTTLVPGSTVSGKVVVVLPFGVLVQTNYDIPGRTPGCALLHNNQFLDEDNEDEKSTTTTKVGVSTKKKQLLPVGTVIENARVINVNRDKGTVNISLRPATNRITKLAALQVGDEVEGKVVRLKQYGAFIDIGHKRNALLHLSRMSMYKVLNITDHVRIGQTVKVRVLRVTGDKDIAVSMLSKENDAFVDRREMQAKRMALWQKVVNAAATDDKHLERAKRELLQVDRAIWDQFMAQDSEGGVAPRRSMEL